MSNYENEYVEAYTELVDVICKLQKSLESLPNADVDHVDDIDSESLEDTLRHAKMTLFSIEGYITYRSRPSAYDQSQAILREAVSRWFGK